MPTFKTEALHLVSNVELVKRLYHLTNGNTPLPCSLAGIHDALRYKAIPISYIDSKCHIAKYLLL